MYQVKFTTTYKKAYKLMKKRGLDISLLDEVVDLLRQGRQLEESQQLNGNRVWLIPKAAKKPAAGR